MIKVNLLTESRADYGIYYPLIKAFLSDSHFYLRILVTGMHLDVRHGFTVENLNADFEVARVISCVNVQRLIQKYPADWLIVLGDRRPMLEATIEAVYRNIPVAHIQGGDRTETIDESARHAITRFAHLHFPTTKSSARRLIKMGEESWRIKVVGALGIYAMPVINVIDKAELCQQLGLDAIQPIVLVIQHPVSTQIDKAGEQMQATLNAVKGWQTVVIYPNNDPGSEEMIKVIKQSSWVESFANLPYIQFISLLRCASVVVGNSSSGIVEAPLFGVPAVNIGNRQGLREQAGNVVNCSDATNAAVIREAIKKALEGQGLTHINPYQANPDGVKIILDTLANTPVDERLLQKRIVY